MVLRMTGEAGHGAVSLKAGLTARSTDRPGEAGHRCTQRRLYVLALAAGAKDDFFSFSNFSSAF